MPPQCREVKPLKAESCYVKVLEVKKLSWIYVIRIQLDKTMFLDVIRMLRLIKCDRRKKFFQLVKHYDRFVNSSIGKPFWI